MLATAPRLVREERGYLMVALLVAMSIMAITMAAMLPAWSTMARREREAELVFRGEQYARAIRMFQQKFGGAFPPDVDALVNERVLRKKYKDPITNDDFQPIAVGDATAGPSAQNPFAPATAGTGRASTPGTGRGTPPSAAPGRQTTSQPSITGQRTGATGTAQTPGGRGGGAGLSGAGTGIMGVTSKSDAPSLRIYKGGDHYNQWLFIATQAQTQAGGRGAQTPGQGTRGGPAGPNGRPGGAGPRGGNRFGGAGGIGPGGGAPGPGRGRF